MLNQQSWITSRFISLVACHDARFMAYAIYLVMLDITSPVLDYLTESQTEMVEKMTTIIAVYYGPAFLKSSKTEHAVLNDLQLIQGSSHSR